MKKCKKCGCDEIVDDEGEQRCSYCGGFDIIETEDTIRESLRESLADYIESCHRQGISFNTSERNRFIRENNHMGLTDEEIVVIEEYTE